MPRSTCITTLGFVVVSLFPAFTQAQTPLTCTVSATPSTVRIEGLAEKMGDIVLGCSGGTPGTAVTGNLSISLTVPITNRLISGTAGDIVVTVNSGSGPVAVPFTAQLTSPQTVSLNGISFTTPPSGPVTLRINNLRGNATSMATGQVIVASLALNGFSTVALSNNNTIVAVPQPGMLSNTSSTVIRCVVSPLPTTLTLANLFAAGTHFESTRLSEGFATAFQPRGPAGDQWHAFPDPVYECARRSNVVRPRILAGSNALQPTAGGDLGTPQGIGDILRGVIRCWWCACKARTLRETVGLPYPVHSVQSVSFPLLRARPMWSTKFWMRILPCRRVCSSPTLWAWPRRGPCRRGAGIYQLCACFQRQYRQFVGAGSAICLGRAVVRLPVASRLQRFLLPGAAGVQPRHDSVHCYFRRTASGTARLHRRTECEC